MAKIKINLVQDNLVEKTPSLKVVTGNPPNTLNSMHLFSQTRLDYVKYLQIEALDGVVLEDNGEVSGEHIYTLTIK